MSRLAHACFPSEKHTISPCASCAVRSVIGAGFSLIISASLLMSSAPLLCAIGLASQHGIPNHHSVLHL
jgi:hypothetical protein